MAFSLMLIVFFIILDHPASSSDCILPSDGLNIFVVEPTCKIDSVFIFAHNMLLNSSGKKHSSGNSTDVQNVCYQPPELRLLNSVLSSRASKSLKVRPPSNPASWLAAPFSSHDVDFPYSFFHCPLSELHSMRLITALYLCGISDFQNKLDMDE